MKNDVHDFLEKVLRMYGMRVKSKAKYFIVTNYYWKN